MERFQVADAQHGVQHSHDRSLQCRAGRPVQISGNAGGRAASRRARLRSRDTDVPAAQKRGPWCMASCAPPRARRHVVDQAQCGVDHAPVEADAMRAVRRRARRNPSACCWPASGAAPAGNPKRAVVLTPAKCARLGLRAGRSVCASARSRHPGAPAGWDQQVVEHRQGPGVPARQTGAPRPAGQRVRPDPRRARGAVGTCRSAPSTVRIAGDQALDVGIAGLERHRHRRPRVSMVSPAYGVSPNGGSRKERLAVQRNVRRSSGGAVRRRQQVAEQRQFELE